MYKRQGIFSFYIKGGLPEAQRFLDHVQLAASAVSLGGVHSVACLPLKTTHSFMEKSDREQIGIRDGTVRFSVGLESIQDLKADLDQALRKAVFQQAGVAKL